jgi:hypothetical protein
MFTEVLKIPKKFAVSEDWESTKDANFKTVTFTGLKFKFTEKVDENSMDRLIYSSKDRSLVVEGADEKTFIERLDRIIFGLLNF